MWWTASPTRPRGGFVMIEFTTDRYSSAGMAAVN
jgi:hypothetical protein